MAKTKSCIACAEQISADAKLCKHCKTMQNDERFLDSSLVAERISAPKIDPYSRTCWNCGSKNQPNEGNCQKCGAEKSVMDVVPIINSRREPVYTGPLETPAVAIASIICAFIFPLLGLILGYSARREIRASKGMKNGDNLATLAITIGWINLIAQFIIGLIYQAAIIGFLSQFSH